MDFKTQTYKIMDLHPTAFTYNSVAYNGCKTFEKRNIMNAQYGRESGYEFSFLCKVDDFQTIPSPKQMITYLGKAYKILGVDVDSVGATFKLNIGDLLG
jgi:hypothetical protein